MKLSIRFAAFYLVSLFISEKKKKNFRRREYLSLILHFIAQVDFHKID